MSTQVNIVAWPFMSDDPEKYLLSLQIPAIILSILYLKKSLKLQP